MNLFRAIATVGGLTMVSRVFGFVRDLMIARYLGAGVAADAFFVALRLPNFFRSLFAEGAFTAGFLPLYSETLNKGGGLAAARRFAEQALALLLPVVLGFSILAQIAMPLVMLGLAPGFADDPARFDLAVDYTRITFPYLAFISLAALYGAVLNGLGRFAAFAATPILLNITMIVCLPLLTGPLGSAGAALAWGTLASGLVQFLWLVWWAARAGVKLRLRWPVLPPVVKRLFALILPAAIGAGAMQINLVIGVILASLLPVGAVSYLFYADRINQLTIGVVGVAISTVLLPALSALLARGDTVAAARQQNRALEFCLLISLPAAAALIIVPLPIMSVLFERGAFDAQAARASADALLAYSIGLPAYTLARALTPGFHARQDTRTPVRIAFVTIAVNLALSLALMPWLGHVGLALATGLAAWGNAGQLAWALYRRDAWQPDARLIRRSGLILLAALLMALALWGLDRALAPWYAQSLTWRVAALALLVGGGMAVYLAAALALRATKPAEWRAMLRRDG
ncbi:murein biosynthesis integral membrane protein MurJ [Ferrovibrio sp.]|uniref:murein biosynthesis integral membrane protein MurJ n=1 Tax=Ferrovibrio sp. TaxID=1917215 RepID=UPI0025B85742|nr:murein biosynthesis integral membrane protein MurJ [Ferrovibrio sp.]MBX3455658.1 murein biosynthesis integral membrane protein MurJ [Ferrovibrio sp.]